MQIAGFTREPAPMSPPPPYKRGGRYAALRKTRTRIWLRATETEWDLINSVIPENSTRSAWIAGTLKEAALMDKGRGFFKEQSAYVRHRGVRGEMLSDEEANPKQGFYCSNEDADLIRGAAHGNDESINLWAVKKLVQAAEEMQWHLRHSSHHALSNPSQFDALVLEAVRQNKITKKQAEELLAKAKLNPKKRQ